MTRIIYHLAPPPRPVPALLRLQVLLGSPLSLFGWAFFGFGMIFFWAFGLASVVDSLFLDRLPSRSAEGVLTGVRETNAKENETPVFAYHFRFSGSDGRSYEGVSYRTGSSSHGQAGERVPVEYPEGRPEKAVISGMRRTTFGSMVLFVTLFPLIGLALAVPGFLQGMKGNHLLANGTPALGKLKSKEPTNTRVNRQTVYRLKFAFQADNGREYEVQSRTHAPEVLEDEGEEPLLYDRNNPSYAVMLDSLPGSPSIDFSGQLHPSGSVLSVLALAIPALAILGNAAVLYFVFLR